MWGLTVWQTQDIARYGEYSDRRREVETLLTTVLHLRQNSSGVLQHDARFPSILASPFEFNRIALLSAHLDVVKNVQIHSEENGSNTIAGTVLWTVVVQSDLLWRERGTGRLCP